ncbi:hypothetical protein MtrunA17_Chr1g0189161 [Medicago truncatula]|uniref:Uncharacterized protein n=1 Tax=Medicago truncatula TaxID=3880 RepID=I3SIH5_MEDTR|nr:unknown [Medicago truncatula]RHN80518.1 hypothetical protein MtrunA17_Chr1g0189161 [Medicago truncatula]
MQHENLHFNDLHIQCPYFHLKSCIIIFKQIEKRIKPFLLNHGCQFDTK